MHANGTGGILHIAFLAFHVPGTTLAPPQWSLVQDFPTHQEFLLHFPPNLSCQDERLVEYGISGDEVNSQFLQEELSEFLTFL